MGTFSQEWKDFGQKIKKAREKHGITIKELSEKTKVNAGLLEAIEEGRREVFPPYVFLRGYVFSCTQALGLKNRSEVLNQLKELSHKEKRFKQESYAEGKVVNELVEKTSYSGPVILVSVGLLALGVVLFFSNWNYTYNQAKEAKVNPFPPKKAAGLETSPGKAVQGDKGGKAQLKLKRKYKTAELKPGGKNVRSIGLRHLAVLPAQKEKEVEVMVRARKNLMFSYRIDEGSRENIFLKKNQFKILKGMQKIWLKTDVLDGLHLFQNGEDLGVLASSNDKEKIFTSIR